MGLPMPNDDKNQLRVRSREPGAPQAQYVGHTESLSDLPHGQATEQLVGLPRGILADSAEIPQEECWSGVTF